MMPLVLCFNFLERLDEAGPSDAWLDRPAVTGSSFLAPAMIVNINCFKRSLAFQASETWLDYIITREEKGTRWAASAA